MPTTKDPSNIPFRQILAVSFTLAAIVQLIIISYNTITGYINVSDSTGFLFRWLYGTILSTMMGLLVIYPDLMLIRMLNRRFPWGKMPFVRIPVQFGGSLLIATIVSSAGTLLAYVINPFTPELFRVIVINVMILSVINISVLIGLEAWIFWRDSYRARQEAARLELQLARIRYEILKSQINPHFLFNSLNVLSGLVYTDPERAERFIDEFGRIYRYVLETIEKPTATVEEELAFARSYLYLQQIRYGEGLVFNVKVDAVHLPQLIPSLSLQVILENAIRHNIISASSPLIIDLSVDNGAIVIKNNINRKLSGKPSTGIGQKNLAERYAAAGPATPSFVMENNAYLVTLPFLTVAP